MAYIHWMHKIPPIIYLVNSEPPGTMRRDSPFRYTQITGQTGYYQVRRDEHHNECS